MGRARLGQLGLLGLLVGLPACWFRLGNATGSVELSWSFNGGQNCRSAGVSQLEVAGAGPTIYLPCVDVPGAALSTATLPAIPAGAQTFVLSGIGRIFDPDAGVSSDRPAYQGTFTFDISEDSDNITAPVDLAPVDPGGSSGDLLLLWTIEHSNCEAAGVSTVDLLTDGSATLDAGSRIDVLYGQILRVPCHADGFASGVGSGLEGVRILGLGPGLYSAPIWAEGRGAVFAAAPTGYVSGYTETVLNVDLHDTREELAPPDQLILTLQFQLPDGGDCQSSGLQLVKFNLERTQVNSVGQSIDGAPPAVDIQLSQAVNLAVPCEQALAGYQIINDLQDPQPCSGFGASNLSCPITAGEYHLSAQGLTAERTAYVLGDYDLWVDQGLINGITAGSVPAYDYFTSGDLAPNVTNFYVVPLPLSQ